jgi:hypothetical protein
MHSLEKIFLASTIACLAGCGGGDPVNGTWNQQNGTIDIPQALGGGTVATNNTLVFDDTVSPGAFTLKMDLSFANLTDTLQAHGTYADDGKAVAFTFTGFDVAQGSGDTASVGDGGSQCITLNALAGATVCFQAQQSQTYTLSGNALTIAITNEIVGGAMGPTTLTLTRATK